MKSTIIRRSRETRAQAIARDLRQQIVRGETAPGSQLPTWDDLERHYDVTRTTLSRVLRQLKNAGFVYASSTRGTFVVDRPPHLHRYALVFKQQPDSPGWNRFWRMLANQAVVLQQGGTKQIPRFFDTNLHVDNESQNHLLADMATDRLAGVMVVGDSMMLSSAIWDRQDLPKVIIRSEVGSHPSPGVVIDRQSFIDKSLDYLKSRGRNRVAVLTSPSERLHGYSDAASARGMKQPAHWRLAAAVEWPDAVRPMVHLLMSLPKTQRPDALIVADDNLVEDAIGALMAGGVRVPDELELIVHCTFPPPAGGVVPMRRLGYDGRQILKMAMELIDTQRRGDVVPPITLVPALFEDEIEAM